ncbi:hypothetical protein WAE61_18300 [Comamonadaceae bacterium PP-2]
MGIYSYLSVEELKTARAQLMGSLQQRLIAPTSAAYAGRSVQFAQQTADIKAEIEAIGIELNRRKGLTERRPIYLV